MEGMPGARLRGRNKGPIDEYPGSVIPGGDDDSDDDDDDDNADDDDALVPFEKAIMALFFAGFFMVVLMAVGLGRVSARDTITSASP